MPRYYSLPTARCQPLIIGLALVGYLPLVGFGTFLFPDISDTAKKKLTQIGLVVLFIASLNAGLAFVWASKARHNTRMAEASKTDSAAKIALLQEQAQQLGTSFQPQIAVVNAEFSEAEKQLNIANALPSVYEWAGSISLILLAVGTLFCFIGAG